MRTILFQRTFTIVYMNDKAGACLRALRMYQKYFLADKFLLGNLPSFLG